MAIETLTEMNKYSTTELQREVIDRLVKDSRILEKLQFETLNGNSLTYNTITTDSTAQFHSPGDTWTESTPVLTQNTVTLKILGDDADIDQFALATRTNKTDLRGTVLDNKVKAVQYRFIDSFFYGNATTNTKEFDGLHTLMTSTTYNTVHAGSGTGTALSVAKLRAALDLLPQYARDGLTAILMSKLMRRGLSVYLDSIGDKFPREVSAWGKPADMWDGLPIFTDDHILDTETASSGAFAASTGGANTSIFIVNFAPLAVCGVHNGGVQVKPLGELETKDAERVRVKWYCGLKFEDIRSSAKVDGIVAAGTVTA